MMKREDLPLTSLYKHTQSTALQARTLSQKEEKIQKGWFGWFGWFGSRKLDDVSGDAKTPISAMCSRLSSFGFSYTFVCRGCMSKRCGHFSRKSPCDFLHKAMPGWREVSTRQQRNTHTTKEQQRTHQASDIHSPFLSATLFPLSATLSPHLPSPLSLSQKALPQ